jgi:pimeloyl-ACP methyl ester carboxylesterase
VPPEVAAALGDSRAWARGRRGRWGAQLVELAGVGHVPPFEAPEAWQQEMLGFLP